jgi:membrane protein DedA with SNARE-associated domain
MLAELFVRYGYVMVFVAAGVEGDATLLAATFLAHRGYLRLDLVIVAAAVGTIAANQFYFHLARRYGLERIEAMRSHRVYGRVLGWMARYGTQLVAVSRFLYGFRIAVPAAAGAAGMSALRFTLVDTIGSAVWAVTIGLAGYAIGQALEYLVADLRRHEWWIAGALLATVLIALARWGRDLTGLRLMKASSAPAPPDERSAGLP